MPAPPSPPYTKGCGKKWYVIETITGELYGKGGFGKDNRVFLHPLASRSDLDDIGTDRGQQQDLDTALRDDIAQIRGKLREASGAGGRRRLLTSKEESAVEWLLDHADAVLEQVTPIWDKWIYRFGGTFPLYLEDRVTNLPGTQVAPGDNRCGNKFGQWVDSVDPRVGRIRCPTEEELRQRPRDREAIKQRFDWALENIRCAQVGLNRLLLYKKSLAEWKEQDIPELVLPTEPIPPPPPGPPDRLPPVLTTPGIDPCAELGIDCPPGEEPEDDDACPDDWCPDTDDLPPPDEVPPPDLGEPLIPEVPPKKKPKSKKVLSDATTGLVVVGALGITYVAYRMLAPR